MRRWENYAEVKLAKDFGDVNLDWERNVKDTAIWRRRFTGYEE